MKEERLFVSFGSFGMLLLVLGTMFNIMDFPYSSALQIIGVVLFVAFWIWTIVNIFKINQSTHFRIFWITIVNVITGLGAWIFYYKVYRPYHHPRRFSSGKLPSIK